MDTSVSVQPTSETKNAFYYQFPNNDKFYIIRWLLDGGYHLFPHHNGELPQGFANYREAEEFGRNWVSIEDLKIVNAEEASKYPVPKRW